MSSLSLAAAHDLLARLPALSANNNSSAQERVASHGLEPDVEEQRRQRLLMEEVQKYQEANDTLRQQLRVLQVENEMDVPLKRQALPQSEEDKKLAQLEHELAHLEATLDALRTEPPPSTDPLLTPSPLSIEDTLNSDLLRTISELEKGVSYEQERAEKERKKGERDGILLQDAEKLNEVLRERVEKMGEKEGVTARDLIDRAEAKAASVSTAFTTLMGALVQFIDERLAKVGDTDEEDDGERGGKKARLDEQMKDIRTYFKPASSNSSYDDNADTSLDPSTPAGKALVLKQLLENLMNASATTPLDPWLIISGPPPPRGSGGKERYQLVPEQLVDFLMRAGVVVEHPRDGRKVRLVEFGRGVGGL